MSSSTTTAAVVRPRPMPDALVERLGDLLSRAIVHDLRARLEAQAVSVATVPATEEPTP